VGDGEKLLTYLNSVLKVLSGLHINLGPSVLFAHFLKHLFLPIMGRFEEPSMGLPILGNQELVNYSLWVM
jgi:hypothetical protein